MKTQKHTKPAKEKAKKSKYDSAWKNVIKKFFKDFLVFFFPDIYHAIDFSKEITFLDKELQEIDPDSNVGDRVADVLVKVHLKDGSTKYICIIVHIEVQGQPKPGFMERMFIYYYRTFDKEKEEKIPVISVALLTDENEKYRPDEYFFSLFGFEIRMKIPIVKIIDFKLKKELREKLGTSTNPMTMVVKAQLKSHEVKKSDAERKFAAAKEFIRQCYKNGYSRDDTRTIMKFFDWVIRFPEALKDRLKEEIKKVEEEYKMEYVPLWERDARQEGWEEGVEIGVEKGVEKGMEKKAKETARKMLEKGFDIDIIIEITGLRKKEIEKMASKSN